MTRDEQIYEDRKTMTRKAIAEKYGLSERQIKRICKIEGLRENIRNLRKDVTFYRNKYYKAIRTGGSPP